MPLEPFDNRTVSTLRYPMSEIRLTRDNDRLCLTVPAYLGIELYRIGILPQDVNIPVEISIGGRPAGRYLVSDVRYPRSPFGQNTFTLTPVLQETAREAARASELSHSRRRETGTHVIDITHYLDESGEVAQLPGPGRKLASFVTLLIESASSTSSADEHDSGAEVAKPPFGQFCGRASTRFPGTVPFAATTESSGTGRRRGGINGSAARERTSYRSVPYGAKSRCCNIN